MSLKSIGNLSVLLKEFGTGTTGLRQIGAALETISAKSIVAAASTHGLTKAQAEQILMGKGLTAEEIKAALATSSFAASQGTATVATGGFSTALKGLWAVMLANPLVSILAGVTAAAVAFVQIQKHIKQATAEAQQATKEAAQSHLDAANSLGEYKTKIKELRDELDSGNLSEEEAYEKRKQLISIQDELVDKIGNEAKAFDILKDSVDDVNRSLDSYTAKEANNLLAENKKAFDTAKKEMEKVRSLGNGMDNTIANGSFINLPENKEIYEQVQQIFNEVFGNNVKFKELADGRISYELKVDAKTAAEGLSDVNNQLYNLDKELSRDGRSLNEVLGLDSFDQSWENAITVAKKEAQEVIDQFSSNYDSMVQLKIQAEFEVEDSQVPEIVSEIEKVKEAYDNAISEGNDNLAKQTYENMQKLLPKIAEIPDEDIANYLTDVVDAFNEQAEDFNVEIELKTKLANNKDSISKMVKDAVKQFENESGKFNKISLQNTQIQYESGSTKDKPYSTLSQDERAYVSLKYAAKEYGMEVDELIDKLEEWGYVQEDTTEIAGNTADAITDLSSTIASLADAETNIKSVAEAFSDFKEEGIVSASTLNDLVEDFGNLSSFNNFIKVMGDSTSSMDDARQACNQLAQEYIDSLGILDSLNEGNAGVVESFLTEMGVVNAHEVVMARLSNSRLEAALAAAGLSEANWEEAKSFLEEKGASESAIAALQQYRIEQLNAALAATNLASASAGTVDALMSQAQAAGVAASSLAALKATMAYNPTVSTQMSPTAIAAYEKQMAKNGKQVADNTKFELPEIKIDVPKISSGGSSGGGSSSKSDDPTKELQEQLDTMLKNFEHQIFILEKKGVLGVTASAADQATQTAKRIVDIYHEMQNAVNKQANTYRSMGLDENSEQIQELQKQWWEYKESIQNVMTSCYEYIAKEHENAITLNNNWLEDAISDNDYAGVTKYTGEIVSHYKAMQDQLHDQAEYYRSLGYSDTSDEVSKLSDLWWQYYNEIKDVSANAWQQIVDNSHDALDAIENVYDTLQSAAEEYSKNGFVTVSTFQEIAKLGVENLAFLEDENGLLVINEENIQKVIAARTEQMAIETALNYIQQLRQALTDNDAVALMNLTNATNLATKSTWDLVYAQLQLLGLDSQQYSNALDRINALRSLSDVAVSGIGKVEGAVEEARKAAYEATKKQADALDDLLKYVMDMIRQEVENQVQAIEDQVDAMRNLVDLQKKSLDLEREKDKYSQTVAEKTKELAKLQQQLSLLELDDSRESIAKQQQLREQMAELSKDLAEDQADHAYDATSDMLDDMLDSYENEKQKEIDVLENTISSEEKVYRLAIERIQTQWDTLYQQLLDWNYEYGSVTDNEITAAWDAACEAVQQYGSYLEAILQTQKQIAEYEASSSSSYSYSSGSGGSGGSDGKDGTSNVVGVVGDYDTSGGQELEKAKNIFKQMYRNAQSWAATTDEAERKRLDEANMKLGTQDLARYGIYAYRKNGAWYDADGSLLFDKYKRYIFHTGGVIGDKPTLKQNELFVKAEMGEAVFTEKQQEGLYRLVNEQETMLARFGNLFQAMSGNNMLVDKVRSQIMQDSQQAQSVTNNAGGTYSITVPMQVYPLQKLDDAEIQGLTKKISDFTIHELDEVFTLRGKRNVR